MNIDPVPELVDDPQIPEFASWRSYRKFEERVKRHRRHIWDREIEAFLGTVMQTRSDRDFEIPEGAVLWRAQLGVEYVLTKDASGEELIEVPMGFPRDRMKPIGETAGEGRRPTHRVSLCSIWPRRKRPPFRRSDRGWGPSCRLPSLRSPAS